MGCSGTGGSMYTAMCTSQASEMKMPMTPMKPVTQKPIMNSTQRTSPSSPCGNTRSSWYSSSSSDTTSRSSRLKLERQRRSFSWRRIMVHRFSTSLERCAMMRARRMYSDLVMTDVGRPLHCWIQSMGAASTPTPANTRNSSQPMTDWMAMTYTGSDTRSFQFLMMMGVWNAVQFLNEAGGQGAPPHGPSVLTQAGGMHEYWPRSTSPYVALRSCSAVMGTTPLDSSCVG
mmetsp:Transcript_6763/g.16844  ORF Transcript_6763/g.16844 Transcript_6763/m.16844 type:complete len:230 (+) Transcript_6763:1202-1891(+)